MKPLPAVGENTIAINNVVDAYGQVVSKDNTTIRYVPVDDSDREHKVPCTEDIRITPVPPARTQNVEGSDFVSYETISKIFDKYLGGAEDDYIRLVIEAIIGDGMMNMIWIGCTG
jgi:hypothetical protein